LVYWDADGRKDLLVGQADGTIKIYLNVNTEENPEFDAGTLLQVGAPGTKVPIDVGQRTTPTPVDWNNDGKKDLVVGAWDGYIRVYINEGTDTEPDFRTQSYVQEGGSNMLVPTNRCSPEILDLDEDGRKDILTGNTAGQLLFYTNVGTDASPSFSGYIMVESGGIPIDLPGTARSRPYVCDWTGDGQLDVLVGASDGLVRLYQGINMSAVVFDEDLASGRISHLLEPYPNPLQIDTLVPFVLGQAGHVEMSVYDVRGQRVVHLLSETLAAGLHRVPWSGLDHQGREVSAGVYFVVLKVAGTSQIRKAVLVR
jgi:hypothetical protein